jgi:hypothetical protein
MLAPRVCGVVLTSVRRAVFADFEETIVAALGAWPGARRRGTPRRSSSVLAAMSGISILEMASGVRSSQYRRCWSTALAAFVLALGSACEASRAEDLGLTVELKPGQEIAFPVAIVDGRVLLGKARLLRPGGAQPKDGEIAVDVVKHDPSPYADLRASEKTSAPVDFVATGLIGNI